MKVFYSCCTLGSSYTCELTDYIKVPDGHSSFIEYSIRQDNC
eukprot:Gb_35623 [translate_table: standard]